MKKLIRGTTGRSTSTQYIKNQLFDYLADNRYLDIDGDPAYQVVDRIEKLAPVFDVDDVINKALEDGVDLITSLTELEDEVGTM